MKEFRHQAEYWEAMERAEKDFRAADPRPLSDRCPYTWSSNMADAYWISAWCLYWRGHLPLALRKTVGHRWKVHDRAIGRIVVTVDKADHRDGINVLER